MTYHISNINQAAQYIIKQLGNKKIVTFTAPMGAGKTTLINAICKQLNVVDATSSPTFSIINEYATTTGNTVYHIDLYRVKDEEELLQTGFEDVVYSGNYCFIEWPQIAESILPKEVLNVSIAILNNEERKLELVTA